MKLVVLCLVAFLFAASAASPVVFAQQLEIERVKDGILQVRTQSGLNIIIQPDGEAKVPQDLTSQQAFVLGTEFNRTFLQTDGKLADASFELNPGEPIPAKIVSIESVLIGKKKAGIQLQMEGLNVLFASVDLMSDQSWITTHQDQNINLLVLTFKDAAKLHTGRTNLWLGLVKTQQIALNPTADAMPVAAVQKFYDSIGKKKVFPTGVLPMLQVPNSNLTFGDRQVVLLKELE